MIVMPMIVKLIPLGMKVKHSLQEMVDRHIPQEMVDKHFHLGTTTTSNIVVDRYLVQ